MTDTRPEHEQRQGIGPCDLCGEHGHLVQGMCHECWDQEQRAWEREETIRVYGPGFSRGT